MHAVKNEWKLLLRSKTGNHAEILGRMDHGENSDARKAGYVYSKLNFFNIKFFDSMELEILALIFVVVVVVVMEVRMEWCPYSRYRP